jgi:hypothetical protein
MDKTGLKIKLQNKLNELEENATLRKVNSYYTCKEYKTENKLNLSYNFEHIENSEELIEWLSDKYFKPIAKYVLNNDFNVKLISLSVSQYYCDEAEDAVHLSFDFSDKDDFDPKYISSKDNIFYYDDNDDDEYDGSFNITKIIDINFFGQEYGGFYPDNDENWIRLMSEYCSGDYDNDGETQLPTPIFYAKLDKDGEVKVKFIGKIIKILS